MNVAVIMSTIIVCELLRYLYDSMRNMIVGAAVAEFIYISPRITRTYIYNVIIILILSQCEYTDRASNGRSATTISSEHE